MVKFDAVIADEPEQNEEFDIVPNAVPPPPPVEREATPIPTPKTPKKFEPCFECPMMVDAATGPDVMQYDLVDSLMDRMFWMSTYSFAIGVCIGGLISHTVFSTPPI